MKIFVVDRPATTLRGRRVPPALRQARKFEVERTQILARLRLAQRGNDFRG